MKHFFTIFLLVFLFVSCSSDDNGNEEMMEAPTENLLLLKTVKENGIVIDAITYDAQNRVVNRVKDFNETIKSASFEHSDNEIIINYKREDGTTGVREIYIYSSNSIRVNSVNITTNEINFSLIYFLNNSTCEIEKSEFQNANGDIFRTISFNYSDDNCSHVASFDWEFPEELNRIVVMNDNKNSFDKSVQFVGANSLNGHNELSHLRYDQNDNIFQNQSYTSSYVYNSDNYPTSEIRTFENGDVVNYTYEYY